MDKKTRIKLGIRVEGDKDHEVYSFYMKEINEKTEKEEEGREVEAKNFNPNEVSDVLFDGIGYLFKQSYFNNNPFSTLQRTDFVKRSGFLQDCYTETQKSKGARDFFRINANRGITYTTYGKNIPNNILTLEIVQKLEEFLVHAKTNNEAIKIARAFNILFRDQNIQENFANLFDDNITTERLIELSNSYQDISYMIGLAENNEDTKKLILKLISDNALSKEYSIKKIKEYIEHIFSEMQNQEAIQYLLSLDIGAINTKRENLQKLDRHFDKFKNILKDKNKETKILLTKIILNLEDKEITEDILNDINTIISQENIKNNNRIIYSLFFGPKIFTRDPENTKEQKMTTDRIKKLLSIANLISKKIKEIDNQKMNDIFLWFISRFSEYRLNQEVIADLTEIIKNNINEIKEFLDGDKSIDTYKYNNKLEFLLNEILSEIIKMTNIRKKEKNISLTLSDWQKTDDESKKITNATITIKKTDEKEGHPANGITNLKDILRVMFKDILVNDSEANFVETSRKVEDQNTIDYSVLFGDQEELKAIPDGIFNQDTLNVICRLLSEAAEEATKDINDDEEKENKANKAALEVAGRINVLLSQGFIRDNFANIFKYMDLNKLRKISKFPNEFAKAIESLVDSKTAKKIAIKNLLALNPDLINEENLENISNIFEKIKDKKIKSSKDIIIRYLLSIDKGSIPLTSERLRKITELSEEILGSIKKIENKKFRKIFARAISKLDDKYITKDFIENLLYLLTIKKDKIPTKTKKIIKAVNKRLEERYIFRKTHKKFKALKKLLEINKKMLNTKTASDDFSESRQQNETELSSDYQDCFETIRESKRINIMMLKDKTKNKEEDINKEEEEEEEEEEEKEEENEIEEDIEKSVEFSIAEKFNELYKKTFNFILREKENMSEEEQKKIKNLIKDYIDNGFRDGIYRLSEEHGDIDEDIKEKILSFIIEEDMKNFRLEKSNESQEKKSLFIGYNSELSILKYYKNGYEFTCKLERNQEAISWIRLFNIAILKGFDENEIEKMKEIFGLKVTDCKKIKKTKEQIKDGDEEKKDEPKTEEEIEEDEVNNPEEMFIKVSVTTLRARRFLTNTLIQSQKGKTERKEPIQNRLTQTYSPRNPDSFVKKRRDSNSSSFELQNDMSLS